MSEFRNSLKGAFPCSRSGSVIRDHSDHGTSNEPMNPCPEWIHRFIWSTIVQDKSNLNIGHEHYPKTVTFFDRDLSTGHVTSFSMWLAWSVRVVALFYRQNLWVSRSFFSSIWLSTYKFCIFILVFIVWVEETCAYPQQPWSGSSQRNATFVFAYWGVSHVPFGFLLLYLPFFSVAVSTYLFVVYRHFINLVSLF